MGKREAETFVVKLIRVRTSRKGFPVSWSYRVTVPRRIVEVMGLKKGDYLKVTVEKVKLR